MIKLPQEAQNEFDWSWIRAMVNLIADIEEVFLMNPEQISFSSMFIYLKELGRGLERVY